MGWARFLSHQIIGPRLHNKLSDRIYDQPRKQKHRWIPQYSSLEAAGQLSLTPQTPAQRCLAAKSRKRVKLRHAWRCNLFGFAKNELTAECRTMSGDFNWIFLNRRARCWLTIGNRFRRERNSIKFDNVVTNFLRVWPAMRFMISNNKSRWNSPQNLFRLLSFHFKFYSPFVRRNLICFFVCLVKSYSRNLAQIQKIENRHKRMSDGKVP